MCNTINQVPGGFVRDSGGAELRFERGNTEITRNHMESISGIYNFTKYNSSI